MADIDERLITISVEIDGQLKKFNQGMAITSTGTKFANPQQNEAMVKIANLTKEDGDYLLTATSPFNQNKSPKKLIIEAGRVSSGLSKIYEGNISTCIPGKPPDIWFEFKCQTAQILKGKLVANAQPAVTTLSTIVQQIAKNNGLDSNFQATDQNVANYAYTGSALGQVNHLGTLAPIDAFVDDNQLVVKNLHVPLKGIIRILDKDSGMIDIPQATEFGVKVKYLLDNESKIGGALQIVSQVYPTLNGKYVIFKLSWDIASRDTPFYWIAEAIRVTDSGGVVTPNVFKKRKGKRKHK